MPKILSHNPYLASALAACLLLVGCAFLQPKTNSPVGDGGKINRVQLDALWAEVQAKRQGEDAKFELARKDLDDQQSTINGVADAVISMVPAVPGPWGALAGAVGAAVAAGIGLDNKRKNSVIKQLKGKPSLIEK